VRGTYAINFRRFSVSQNLTFKFTVFILLIILVLTNLAFSNAAPGIPDAPLSPDGPWFVFTDHESLWAVNPDGSGLIELASGIRLVGLPDKINRSGFEPAVAPKGGHLAFITAEPGTEWDHLTLHLLSLPAGEIKTITPLNPYQGEERSQDPFVASERNILGETSLAWSADGSMLAFMGIIDGPSTDLYVYSLADESITRLTSGPGQGILPSWSPDGRYIFLIGIDNLGSGAGWAGPIDISAVPLDGSAILTPYVPPEDGSYAENFLGWISDDTFVVNSWHPRCGAFNLRSVSISGQETVVWAGSFIDYTMAFDPDSGYAMLNGSLCEGKGQEGLFLVNTKDGQTLDVGLSNSGMVRWDPADRLFYILANDSIWWYSTDPISENAPYSLQYEGTALPIGSPVDNTLAFGGSSTGLWIGDLEQPARQVFEGSAYNVTWAPDGQSFLFLHWHPDTQNHSLYAAYAPDFEPVEIFETAPNTKLRGVTVWP
jgi:hypothetical protein